MGPGRGAWSHLLGVVVACIQEVAGVTPADHDEPLMVLGLDSVPRPRDGVVRGLRGNPSKVKPLSVPPKVGRGGLEVDWEGGVSFLARRLLHINHAFSSGGGSLRVPGGVQAKGGVIG